MAVVARKAGKQMAEMAVGIWSTRAGIGIHRHGRNPFLFGRPGMALICSMTFGAVFLVRIMAVT